MTSNTTWRIGLLALILALTIQPSVHVQTCIPVRLQVHSGWFFNVAAVYGGVVPEGTVWAIDRGGVASNDSASREIMFQVNERVVSQGNACCWAVPAARSYISDATPKAALGQPLVLLPGDQLVARMNAPLADLALLYSGWTYPLGCLPQVLGVYH